MARPTERKRSPKDDKRRVAKKRPNPLTSAGITFIDYKDINLLRRFMSDRGKIRARRVTGVTEQQQRDIASAIKTARELALLPYLSRTATERAPRRGPRAEQNTEAKAESDAAADTEAEDLDDGDDEDEEA